MKKRYIGRNSESLASGRVMFPGDTVDVSGSEWGKNPHLHAVLIDVPDDEAPEAPAPEAEPKIKAKTNSSKSDKE